MAADRSDEDPCPDRETGTSDQTQQSPFVSKLRMEVAANRSPSYSSRQWEMQPSIGSWLTPRGRNRVSNEGAASSAGNQQLQQSGGRRVCFAENEDARPPLPPELSARGAAASGSEQQPPALSRVSCKLELNVKGSASKPFTFEDVDSLITIADLKALCKERTGLPVEQQRLLHKGKVLQDHQTLDEAKIPNKGTLFLVKGAAAASSSDQAAPKEAEQQNKPAEDPQAATAKAAAQGPQGPPCVGCGVNPGRPQTNGLCSICWREQVVKENREMKKRREQAKKKEEEAVKEAEEKRLRDEELELRRQQDTSRCYACRKKIGLTGFLCQCGFYYCATHRYAEEHGCTFDHQAHGRDILAQKTGAARDSSSN
mmetsp:Transcript_26929/g.78110  ORF Transcript_26929/g.78110 Transcript_26929/m.78110 type:complete len:370 (+) Transcript_26929:100-1209(+)|eukprot:CAMPEP_0170261036 /NCGR_PEP_ID=MMETSP0116_2-20130129/30398_1 /TAXON_ID=400756 /ORGANISM="Durinskia baltica, Strain CSIRO CS-38" /LENGTH=369 /DNA_ID=CAMNT_0010512099 /DNA_START=82 /DNA_END=1191 /DNA_ORIENTATION=-